MEPFCDNGHLVTGSVWFRQAGLPSQTPGRSVSQHPLVDEGEHVDDAMRSMATAVDLTVDESAEVGGRLFGGGYQHVRHFRAKFKEPLALALAAYPEAQVTADESGLLLLPSPLPVPQRHLIHGISVSPESESPSL